MDKNLRKCGNQLAWALFINQFLFDVGMEEAWAAQSHLSVDKFRKISRIDHVKMVQAMQAGQTQQSVAEQKIIYSGRHLNLE